jgi:hypothetical protein
MFSVSLSEYGLMLRKVLSPHFLSESNLANTVKIKN